MTPRELMVRAGAAWAHGATIPPACFQIAQTEAVKIKTLVPWYGSNRMLASEVGRLLDGCEWVGIPFAGGMCEVAEINARTIVANDIHRHLINLANVIASEDHCWNLKERLSATLFHSDILMASQVAIQQIEDGIELLPVPWAYYFFICCWMTRSETAGTKTAFTQKLSVRWNAGGGDSAVRFRSAVDSIEAWHEIFRRRNVTFTTSDCFVFLAKCKDQKGHGIYCDPPFPDAGQRYAHAPAKGEEADWHKRLRDRLEEFTAARIVVRYHANNLVEDLYRDWERVELTGRAQTNAARNEFLFVRNAD